MPLTPGRPSLPAGLRPALLPGERVRVAGTPVGLPARFTFREPEGRP